MRYEFVSDGGGRYEGGAMRISIDGKQVASGRIEKTILLIAPVGETFDIGRDTGLTVHSELESDGRNWAGYGRTFSEQRHSPLRQIDARNIRRLGLVWSLELETPGNVATAPPEVDGVIYFGVGLSVIHAVDAITGKLLWRYDPETVRAAGARLRRAWGIRGIALWKRTICATSPGRLR